MNSINSQLRSKVGKNSAQRIRNKGYIPAIIYGKGSEPVAIQLDQKETSGFLRKHGETSVIQVNLGGKMETVLIKEIQRNPITNEIIHMDLQRVSHQDRINVKVPIVLKGKRQIAQSGVILQQQLKEVEVACYADKIPKKLVFDISNFRIGDTLRVADMEISEEFYINHDPQSIIASIAHAEKIPEPEEEA